MESLNQSLDILGQQPLLANLYTQICFCYPIVDSSAHPKIIDTLKKGLDLLATGFPWTAGRVVNEGSGDGTTGTFRIKPLGQAPGLVAKDLRDDPSMPTMENLRNAGFPMSMLDEKLIAPRTTLPQSTDQSDRDSAVLLLQATFIVGGLVLTVVGLHSVMDMSGQFQLMYILSKACNGGKFTQEELKVGNLDRHSLVPLLDESFESEEDLKTPPKTATASASNPPSSESTAAQSATPPKCSWASFTFDSASLADLKALAATTVTLKSGYVSTDDALSALIWRAIARARQSRLDPATKVTFARAVDVRRYLGIPETYPGLMQNMTYTAQVQGQLVQEPIGGIASKLRLELDPKTSDIAYRTRAIATRLERSANKNDVGFVSSLDLSADVTLSSWAKFGCYALDFGLGLGKPEAVQRPLFDPVESLIYLLPRAPNGEIASVICLRDEDMARLKQDEEFNRYIRCTG